VHSLSANTSGVRETGRHGWKLRMGVAREPAEGRRSIFPLSWERKKAHTLGKW
jgi:hypothetical protein